ncbi:hypothetical protein ACSBR1_001996 [Camellia fascicularis]
MSRKHKIKEKEKENECIHGYVLERTKPRERERERERDNSLCWNGEGKQGESLGKSEELKRDSRNCEETHQIEGFG